MRDVAEIEGEKWKLGKKGGKAALKCHQLGTL